MLLLYNLLISTNNGAAEQQIKIEQIKCYISFRGFTCIKNSYKTFYQQYILKFTNSDN